MSLESTTITGTQSLELTAQLALPDSGLARVAVVCLSGGGAGVETAYSEWQAYMADNGIASLALNARGKDGSDGYWSTRTPVDGEAWVPGKPVNSQHTRVLDTLSAFDQLPFLVESDQYALIGSSMGGDVAVHAAYELRGKGKPLGALVLKSPAAYNPAVHTVPFGNSFTAVTTNHDKYPPMDARNFQLLSRLSTPTQLFYARGEEVILPEIVEAYKRAISERAGNEVIELGNVTTEHGYFTGKDKASRNAKEETIERSTQFILKNCCS